MSRQYQILIFLLMCSLLTTCASKPSALLNDDTCDLPCWRGIEVGQSTTDEVEVLVNNMLDVTDVSPVTKTLSKYPYFEETINWNFDNTLEDRGEVYFQNKVTTIFVIRYEYPHNISEFVEEFGEPTYVFIQSTKGDPFVYTTVDILYMDSGVCFSYKPKLLNILRVPKNIHIYPNTDIEYVRFTDPSIPNSQLISGCMRGAEEKIFQRYRQEWKGYEKYDVLDWSEVWSQN